MNDRRWRLLLFLLLLLSVSAYILQDAIYRLVIVPVTYLFWLAVYAYSFIPQVVLWIALVVVLLIVGVLYFLPAWEFSGRAGQERKLSPGPVENLTLWLLRSRKGTYFKWQIANRLARLARRAGYWPGGQRQPEAGLETVFQYLDAGLNTSFADYPRPRTPFEKPAWTPLDIDPETAVDYLESQMEWKDVRNP